MQYPLVLVPSLTEDDFIHGNGFTTYAKHEMAGYGSFIVSAYGAIFEMRLTGSEMLGTSLVYEYIDEESEMVAYVGRN